jgi:probable F420-dependent oxidoreductase
MQLGRTGLWTYHLDLLPAPAAREAVQELEALGYGAIWVPEAVNREPFVNSALLLGATERLVVATGIASVWARDAMTMAAGQLSLCEAFEGRFLLGLGVSHQPMVDNVRGHAYDKPLTKMRAYLEAMDGALYFSPRPAEEPRRVLAALGPKMLELAAEQALGAHPYFVPVEHTAFAREVLGEGPMLCPEQAVVLSTDPGEARAAARPHMAPTTPTTCAASVGTTTTWPRPAATGSSTPSSRGGTRPPSSTACAPTSMPAPTTCASRCSAPTPSPCRCRSGARWRNPFGSCDPSALDLTRGSRAEEGLEWRERGARAGPSSSTRAGTAGGASPSASSSASAGPPAR